MLFMVIEAFANQDPLPAYRRLRDEGRVLPEGLTFVDSWIEANFARCFQIMETNDAALLQRWVLSWRNAGVTFEIVPVTPSATVRDLVAPAL